MRRLQFGIVGSALCALALTVLLAGCGKDKDDDKDGKTKPTDSGPTRPRPSATLKPIEGKGTGALKGKITLKGGDQSAALADLTKNLHAEIAKKDDKEKCMSGSAEETTQQVYRIGGNKQVGNVVVWLRPSDKDSFFPIDKKQADEAKAHPVEISQPHCAFLPHVATYFPSSQNPKKPKEQDPTGQEMVVKNDAVMQHNTNWKGGPKQPDGNKLLGIGESIKIPDLVPDYALPLTLKCNIHGWMDAYVWIFDHPYAAVSKSDTAPKELRVKADDGSFGTYEIKGAPTGVKLRVVAWHEKSGFLNGGPNGEEIELKDGETTKDFEVEVKP
jgi:hypothetical protein